MFSGLGGNRKLWEGVSVTAVEQNSQVADIYKTNFPSDTVIIGDANSYLEQHYSEFDFIWSSPPCQSHSKMVKATRHKARKLPDVSLYSHILFLQNFYSGKWVVENVQPYYAPLIQPTAKIGRHLFWSSCKHLHWLPEHMDTIQDTRIDFMNSDDKQYIEAMKQIYGISYDGNVYFSGRHSPGQALRNCVPPSIGLLVFNSAK